MELKPHDLIRVYNPDDLLTDLPLPAWAAPALLNAPYVVVRRAMQRDSRVPVGIRGSKRSERLAAWLKISAIHEVVLPEMLVSLQQWKIEQHELNNCILSLQKIIPVLNEEGLNWGPTGSTAFELATGAKVLKTESDLDLVIRCSGPLTVKKASLLLGKLKTASLVRLDIQLETPMGGVSLAEYVSSAKVLVKSASGPHIIQKDTLWNHTARLVASKFQP